MKIYTCGYMFESGRFNWRHAFECKIKHPWITWLHPDPDEEDAEVYLYNDKQMIIDSDVVLIYVDLVVARYLGAMLELGMAYCLGKKIIMIDLSPDVDSLTMARKCCDFVLPTIGAGIQLLEKMANEQTTTTNKRQCVKRCVVCGFEGTVGPGQSTCPECGATQTMVLLKNIDKWGRCTRCKRPRKGCDGTNMCGLCENGHGPEPLPETT